MLLACHDYSISYYNSKSKHADKDKYKQQVIISMPACLVLFSAKCPYSLQSLLLGLVGTGLRLCSQKIAILLLGACKIIIRCYGTYYQPSLIGTLIFIIAFAFPLHTRNSRYLLHSEYCSFHPTTTITPCHSSRQKRLRFSTTAAGLSHRSFANPVVTVPLFGIHSLVPKASSNDLSSFSYFGVAAGFTSSPRAADCYMDGTLP